MKNNKIENHVSYDAKTGSAYPKYQQTWRALTTLSTHTDGIPKLAFLRKVKKLSGM